MKRLLWIKGVSYYTHKTKSILGGWSRAFFMLPLTYLLPGNILVYSLDKIADQFEKFNLKKSTEYFIMSIIGILFVMGIILLEAVMIENFAPLVCKFIRHISKLYNIQIIS